MKASNAWRRFALLVSPSDIEAASLLLQIASGANVAVEQGGDDAALTARATITAYVREPSSSGIARLLQRAVRRARSGGELSNPILEASHVVIDEDWAESWKRFYTPFSIAPGWTVAPSWETKFVARSGARVLRLDPGMAFGTGQHPTTRAALQFVLAHARPRSIVIDVGCGSGILGIAAAMAGARVFACDLDPIAVDATRKNFRTNNVCAASVRRSNGPPTGFPKAHIVVANITADALVRLASVLARKLCFKGVLVSAGIHRAGRRAVLDAFAAQKLLLLRERRSGEWSAFVHARR